MVTASDHGRLMDDIYRVQRRFYDVTRKYYLLGRDTLITDMQVAPGQTVLEIACGTGRNLARIGQRYPDARLFGLDISEQMLISARRKLDGRATLARADACAFDPEPHFGVAKFDHIVLSYSLSMIPDWQGALRHAFGHLAPGGSLHIVDFGTQEALPLWFKRGLRAWLDRFHVSPRDDLPDILETLRPAEAPMHLAAPFRTYAVSARLTAPLA